MVGSPAGLHGYRITNTGLSAYHISPLCLLFCGICVHRQINRASFLLLSSIGFTKYSLLILQTFPILQNSKAAMGTTQASTQYVALSQEYSSRCVRQTTSLRPVQRFKIGGARGVPRGVVWGFKPPLEIPKFY
jgi:hypothetical protein